MTKTHYELSLEAMGSALHSIEQAMAHGAVGSALLAALHRDPRVAIAYPYAFTRAIMNRVPDPYDLRAVLNHEETKRLILDLLPLYAARLDPRTAKSWIIGGLVAYWSMACYAREGERTYEISPGLGERLLHTELHGLRTDDLKLPYRSIYIVIPETLGLTVLNAISGQHPLTGIYITEQPIDGERGWRVMTIGKPRDQMGLDDALFHFRIKLPGGTAINDAITAAEHEAEVQFTAGEGAPEDLDYYRRTWRQVFSLIMNVVIYCTWPDAKIEEVIENTEWLRLREQMQRHPKGSHKYERARTRLRETSPRRRIILGRGVPRLETGGETVRGPLQVRTLVSGHWQRFAHGEGRKLRKWGWREPFWRGPTQAEEHNPVRVLGES